MFFAFREREKVLDVFEKVSGLRMNMAYIRPGGVAQDLPDGTVSGIRELIKDLRKNFKDNAKLLIGNSIWIKRTKGVGYLDLAGCITLGVTGPVLRSTGMPWDLRKTQPYCGYENYDFDVITADTCDVYGRFLIRMQELEQSLRIIEQCCDKLDKLEAAPVMVADKKIAWPAQLSLGGDGLGNSLDHIRQIMGTSMEALIHHFKIVTEGFRVPAGQVYTPVESPRGELGAHLVSDGGTRPYRVHFRAPSFSNLQSTSAMCEGSLIADVVAAVASIDPVMGDVDR
jgi:NADH-quinone oxidoreductase subunit D